MSKVAKRGKKSPELMDEIIMRISNGEPLRQICRDDHMPSWVAVYDWLEADKEFSLRFTRARDIGEDAIAQECFDIADNATNDWMESSGKDGGAAYKLNGEHIQRSKLRIETRLKLLSKWNPRKWGDKVDLTSTDGSMTPKDTSAEVLAALARKHNDA